MPPSEDRNVRVTVTGRPCFYLSACWSALSADAVGVTVKLKLPAAATARLPFAKMTSAGRQRPVSLTWPLLHFLVLAANTTNFPSWKVTRERSPQRNPRGGQHDDGAARKPDPAAQTSAEQAEVHAGATSPRKEI